MGCAPSKEGSANAQEPVASKNMDGAMAVKSKEAMDDKSGASALASANIIFVLGGPGSGKGTQSDKILQKCAFDLNVYLVDSSHITTVRSRSRIVQTNILFIDRPHINLPLPAL